MLKRQESNFHMGLILLKIFIVAAVFVLTTLITSKSAAAATYYVNASTGNNSYTTTQAQNPETPWLTLNKAEGTASDGDTVHAAAGTYVETAAGGQWSISKAITWIADGQAIVRGSNSSTLFVFGTGATSITGFTIDSEGSHGYNVNFANGAGNKTLSNMTFTGATTVVVDGIRGSNIVIQNSTFTIGNNVIALSLGAGNSATSISGNAFNFTTCNRLFRRVANGGSITFSNNTITGTSCNNPVFDVGYNGDITLTGNVAIITGTISDFFVTTAGTGALTMNNNTISLSTKTTNDIIFISAGIWAVDINGNTLTSTAIDQVYSFISLQNQYSSLIRNNTIDTNSVLDRGQIFIRSTGTAGGTLLISGNTLKSRSDTFVINIGTDTATAGSTKFNGAIIENNTIFGPIYYDPSKTTSETHAIFYSQNVNGIIRHNTIIGTGMGIVVKGTGESYSSGGIYYNKLINCNGVTSIRIKGVKNVPVYNNSFWSNSTLTSRLINITQYNAGETSTGSILKNNIFYGSNAQGIAVEDGSQTNFTSDYNVFFRDTGNIIGTIASTDYSSLNAWQTVGFDANGSYSNPLFTNTGTYNLIPLYNSPAIDAGTSISGLTQDILGNPIYGAPDIGAYEYQPPYTMGTNELDIVGDVRIYADGKFRNTQTVSGNTADLSVAPVSGFGTGNYSEWMNIDISTWDSSGTYRKTWTESSSSIGSASTVHTVGDLRASKKYLVKVNGVLGANVTGTNCSGVYCTSDSEGKINFTYSGGYSTVTFDVEEDSTAPTVTLTSTTVTAITATIRWGTNEEASSKIVYGLTSSYEKSTLEIDLSPGVLEHTVTLTGLTACTTYHFNIESKDIALNLGVDTDHTFKTLGCISQTTTNSSHNLVSEVVEEVVIPSGTDDKGDQSENVSYVIKIRVVDKDNKPIEGAKVDIWGIAKTVTTDSNGIAEFSQVEAGEYTLKIAYDGKETEQKVEVKGDSIKEITFSIQLKETEEDKDGIDLGKVGIVLIITLATGAVVLLFVSKKKDRKDRNYTSNITT